MAGQNFCCKEAFSAMDQEWIMVVHQAQKKAPDGLFLCRMGLPQLGLLNSPIPLSRK
jgi:hypothetical protein